MNTAAMLARWDQLAPREKLLVAAAGAVVGIAIAWAVLLAPAVRTLRAAESQHRVLDAQLQQMRRLQAQAQQMQAQPRQGHEEALRLLEVSIRQQFGAAARYTIAGERVTVTLAGVSSEAFAQWLTQARVNARALPGETRLTRTPAGLWEGTLVLTLPPR